MCRDHEHSPPSCRRGGRSPGVQRQGGGRRGRCRVRLLLLLLLLVLLLGLGMEGSCRHLERRRHRQGPNRGRDRSCRREHSDEPLALGARATFGHHAHAAVRARDERERVDAPPQTGRRDCRSARSGHSTERRRKRGPRRSSQESARPRVSPRRTEVNLRYRQRRPARRRGSGRLDCRRRCLTARARPPDNKWHARARPRLTTVAVATFWLLCPRARGSEAGSSSTCAAGAMPGSGDANAARAGHTAPPSQAALAKCVSPFPPRPKGTGGSGGSAILLWSGRWARDRAVLPHNFGQLRLCPATSAGQPVQSARRQQRIFVPNSPPPELWGCRGKFAYVRGGRHQQRRSRVAASCCSGCGRRLRALGHQGPRAATGARSPLSCRRQCHV